MLTLNQTIVPPSGAGKVCFLLDLALSADGEWDSGDQELPEKLQQLHDREHEIFEATITDRVRKGFS